MDNYNKILETSLQNLRMSLTSWSMDEFIVSTIESLMNIERQEYLEKLTSADKGNGHYTRAFKSFSKNCLTINIPRTRTGEFTPNTIELIKTGQEQINELCLALYKKGMTSRDISDLIGNMFGDNVSASKVTNLSKTFNDFRITWQNSKLEKSYKVIFCDCLFITVRREDSYSREAVYLAIGVREDNKREVVALSINPTESASEWGEIFKDLKNKRGVEKVDLFAADGIVGLENQIHSIYPEANFQKCCVHKIREILKKARPKDKYELAQDLKKVFDNFDKNDTVENAFKKVDDLILKWKKKYPNMANFFKQETTEYYFTYIKYHTNVRRMIYTTNCVENVNRIIRKGTKNKLSFENPENLLNYIFVILKEFEEKNFMKYSVHNYKYFERILEQTHFS